MSFKRINVSLDKDYCQNYLRVNASHYVGLELTEMGSGLVRKAKNKRPYPFDTTKTNGQGPGLGLAMAYSIFKSHKPAIHCKRQSDNDPSVETPLPDLQTESKHTDNASACIAPTNKQTETVLLVDDEEAIQGFGKVILEKFGYQALLADSGEKAIEIYKSENQKIDLVILDLKMPGMGGQKCLKELIKMNPNIKVIFASGFCPQDRVKELINEGASGYIQKPYMLEDLQKSVHDVLERE